MLTPEILTRFKGVTGSYGHYMAKCPCHKDNKASLSITAKKGVTLIHCFAGCWAGDILEKVGLTFDDLWDKENMP